MALTANSKLFKFVAGLALLVLTYLILKELQSFLIPFFLALIIFFIFEPLYNSLLKRKVPSAVAIIIILLIIIIISNTSSAFVIASVNSFSAEFPKYEAKFIAFLHSVMLSLNYSTDEITKLTENLKLTNLLKVGSVTAFLSGVFTSVLGVLGDFVLILLYLVFLFSEMTSLRQRIKRAYAEKAGDIDDTFNYIFGDIKKYLIGKTFMNLIQGIVFGLILWIFGVDFALIWGFLCFLAHYIPNIGSLIATILPFITAMLQFDSLFIPVIILIILIVVQNLIGNIIEPMYLGDQLDLSPLMILIFLLFWGYVWGIIGMILAVPILSIMKIVFTRIKETRPLAIILSYKDPDPSFGKKKIGDYVSNIKSRRKKTK